MRELGKIIGIIDEGFLVGVFIGLGVTAPGRDLDIDFWLFRRDAILEPLGVIRKH